MPGDRQGAGPLARSQVDPAAFNPELALLYELRAKDFDLAMQDVYDWALSAARRGRASRAMRK